MLQSPFESLSVSFRPLDRGALDSLRSPADVNQLHSFRGSDASPFSHVFDNAGGLDGAHALSLDVARGLPVPGAMQVQGDAGREFVGPSLQDQVSFLNGVDQNGDVAEISYWTWKRNIPATFANKSSVAKWGSDHVTTDEVVTVNFNFHQNSDWTSTEKGVFESCMALWSAVTNVAFNEVEDVGDAQLIFKRNDFGSAFSSTQIDSGDNAGEIGQEVLSTKVKNLISIDTDVPGFGPIDGDFTAFGGYVWGTVIHELGHSLGLGHAGAYNGGVNPNTQQFSAYDNLLWSVMSYIGPDENSKYDDEYPVEADWGTSPDGYGNTATTWMALDILAVQGLYGTPLSTPLSGGQTFGFNCDIGGDIGRFFDFTQNVNPVVTLWSAGTDNTLDLSGFNKEAAIDLNPGAYTSCDGKIANIVIAFGTVFETAIGGKANDSFVANEFGNTFVGNKGNDVMHAGAGSDVLIGGKGNDRLAFDDVDDSTGALFDTAKGFDFDSADRFALPVAVGGVDATVGGGALSEASFDTDLETAIGASELGAGNAVLFAVDAGDFAGETFLLIDGNGTAGYQAGGDFVLLLDGAKNIGFIDGADFI